MAITKFVPELWEAALLLPFEKSLVYGQPSVVNRNYEGEIKQKGDTVHIGTIADPTVRAYDKTTDLTIEDLADDELLLTIDQGDYFAFRVNDVDKVQAAGDFQGPATQRAGFGLKDKVDRFIAGKYTGVDAANNLGDVTVTTADGETAYDVLVELEQKLDEADAPSDGRYATVPPSFRSMLQRDDRFAMVGNAGSDETLRNGLVGRACGFDILVTNNAPAPAAGKRVVQAGIPAALSMAMQITETEALRAQNRFADIVRGLQVYGAKLVYPKGIAVATVAYA